MATLERKSFNNPNETRTFPLAKAEFVSFGAMPVVRATYEPGWRWSEHAKSVFGRKAAKFLISGILSLDTSPSR